MVVETMHDLPVSFHFKVEFGNSSDDQDNRFQEVAGLSAEITTEEVREGGLNEYVHRLPTGTKYGNLVLKRGYLGDGEIVKSCRRAVEEFSFETTSVLASVGHPC